MITTASPNGFSISSGTAIKVNKSTPQSRKGNSLRLSLRRFSHHGTTSSSKASKTDTANSDTNSSTLDLEIYSWSRCQQAIYRLAQGQKVEPEERVKISISVRNLLIGSRNLAIVLLSELFAASGLPVAFRQLAATFDKCSPEDSIAALWLQFFTVILPDLHAVLYPFEESTFSDIRKMILIAFRDGVVLDEDLCFGLLNNGNGSNVDPLIQRMLLILEQNTRDASNEYAKIQALCENLVDGFSSLEMSFYQQQSASGPHFFIADEELPQRPSSSPKPLQKLLRRAKGSFSALTSGEQSDLGIHNGFLEVKSWNQGRSQSPLARVRNALLSESAAETPRRHSYAPGSM